jgi:hypothetical protein
MGDQLNRRVISVGGNRIVDKRGRGGPSKLDGPDGSIAGAGEPPACQRGRGPRDVGKMPHCSSQMIRVRRLFSNSQDPTSIIWRKPTFPRPEGSMTSHSRQRSQGAHPRRARSATRVPPLGLEVGRQASGYDVPSLTGAENSNQLKLLCF